MSVKSDYAAKERLLEIEQEKARKAKRDADYLKDETEKVIQNRVRSESEEIKRNLKFTYDSKFLAAVLYGMLVTVFTARESKWFSKDFKNFFLDIWKFMLFIYEKIKDIANMAAGMLTDMITDMIQIDPVVQQYIAGAVIILLIAIIVAVVFLAIYCLFNFYTDIQYGFVDENTLTEVLVSLAIIVWFDDEITNIIPINLLLLFIMVHVLYIGVRYYMWRKSQGYC